MFGICVIIIGFIAYFVARFYESVGARGYMRELRRLWRTSGIPGRCILVAILVTAAIDGRTKGPNPLASLYRVLFWQPEAVWSLTEASQNAAQAAAAVNATTNAIAAATNTAAAVEAYVASNRVATISFDWHSPDRLPMHDRQNVLGRTVQVIPTNINGALCEDHYVAFSAQATTNPAVILIEYARTMDDGTVERYSAKTVTNSYPVRVLVTVQSGTHTCYWFRCEVPAAFTASVRDWNGEALFGSPQDSGKGFDLLGTLVVDDGDNVWVGANTNMVIGGLTNTVRNGIITEGSP